MKATYGFDGDNWKFKALEDYIAYKELYEFVGNKVAVQAHIDSYQIISRGSDLPREYPEQLLRMGKVSTLQHAVVHLASQTVVSLCATFEVAVREFLRAFFITYPASLFDFIGPNDAKGHVSLSEIIDSESRNELIVKLATRASGVASKGKYNQVFSRVSALCGAPSKSELAVHLSQAQSDRNKIVHERRRAACKFEDVKRAYETVDNAINALCYFGTNKKVPGRYSCLHTIQEIVIPDDLRIHNDT